MLFVDITDDEASQTAAALMRRTASADLTTLSAGSRPAGTLDVLSVTSLREVGVDITAQRPSTVRRELVVAVDLVVVLTRQAVVPYGGRPVVRWDIVEPFERGVSGLERMRLVCDDLVLRTDALLEQLTSPPVDDGRRAHGTQQPLAPGAADAPRQSARAAAQSSPAHVVGRALATDRPRHALRRPT